MIRSCEYVAGTTFSPVTMLLRLPLLTATRSMVVGVESGNFAQPPSSGPAVALLLNHSSWVVTHTCEYCGGVLPVSDTSVRAEHAASRQPSRQRGPGARGR